MYTPKYVCTIFIKSSEVESLSHCRLFATPWILHPWDFQNKSTAVSLPFLLRNLPSRDRTQASHTVDRCFTV